MNETERDATKTGVELIAAERERQISQEGWTPKHDDEHFNCELNEAAQCYADYARKQARYGTRHWNIPHIWPWEASWWKAADNPIRNLVKAGALIAAEIDRLQRKDRHA